LRRFATPPDREAEDEHAVEDVQEHERVLEPTQVIAALVLARTARRTDALAQTMAQLVEAALPENQA
jgi:hypothetical protein